jgi:hypothetical protein
MAQAFEKLLKFISSRVLYEVVADWWASEGKLVFQSRGGRIGKSWRTDNKKTGRLERTVSKPWRQITQNGLKMGIVYDRRAYTIINAQRPVFDIASVQMSTLDAAIQRRLDRDVG